MYVGKNGAFTMYGGIIEKNNGVRGGGLHNAGGAFTMTGGTIRANSAAQGAGVYSSNFAPVNAKFEMTGGTIIDNTASYYGGGVLTQCESKMTGGTITGNKAKDGGGLYIFSYLFDMTGGTITKNTAESNGGGVCNSGGNFSMSGVTTISYNEAANYGGGVYNWKTFSMNDGTITNNTAPMGGGVFHAWDSATTTTLSGAPIVTGNGNGNTENNLYIYCGTNSKPVTASGLTTSAKIGISASTTDTGALITGTTNTDYFFSDLNSCKLESSGNGLTLAADSNVTGHTNHCICVGNAAGSSHQHDYNVNWQAWTETTKLPNNVGNYYLTQNVEISKAWQPANGTVLCLNGKNITINGDVEGITVGKNETSVVNFILTDCKTGNAQGEITHAAGKESRGVYIYHKCQFDMYGGSITGNTLNAAGGGAGVGASGTFNMYGGSISNNIARNEAEYGGGVFVGGSGQFNMYGGSITGNTSTTGGGVFVNVNGAGTSIGKFNISGNVNITNNKTEGKDDNVCLEKSNDGNKTASINIAGTLDAAAKIGVTTAKKPTDAPLLIVTNADENTNYDGIITSDDTQYEITRDTNVKTNLVLKKIETPAQKHRVTITAGEGMTTTGNASQTDLTGAMTDVVYTAADGYYFPESYSVADTNGIKVTRNNETQITVSGTPTADTTIKLPAATKKVTIIFDANGGWFTSATHIKSTVKFKVGEIITVPTYAAIKSDKKYNYEFVGWYTEKEGGTLLGDNTKATADTIYYAHWTQTPIVYTIEYILDGGEIKDTNYRTTYTCEDEIINLPTNVTKDGYEFIGWRINSGTGNLYGSEWEVNENNLRNLTFYVCWTKKSTETTYEITFDANVGTVSPANARTADDGILASLPTPTRDGYTFTGWYTAAIGGTKIEDGHKFTDNGTIYAHWTKNGSSGGSSGGGSSTSRTDVTTTGNTDNKVTSSPSQVKSETKTDADGNSVTTATVTVSSANQREILKQAKANKSGEIIIKVSQNEVKEGAKVEMNLDKAFIESILNDTDAKLTIQTPSGEKTFTQEELKKLAAEATGNTVTIDPTSTDMTKPTTPTEPTTPTNPSADKKAKLVRGVQNTTIVLKSKLTKAGNVLLTWTKSKGYKVDRFEVYRSVKKNSGYGTKAFFSTKNGSAAKYLNTKNLKAGKTYYYKVRGVRTIDGQKYYTQWSNKAWRTVKKSLK